MGTPITKDNPLTYHHIEKRNDNNTTLQNGALLTKSSHRKLHMLESRDIDLYNEWNWLFYAINIPYKQIIFCSRFGIYSSLISIFIYLFFEFKKDLIDSLLDGLILLISSFSFYYYFTYILGFIPVYGRFCMISNFIAFLYYAYIIYQVIITNNYVLIDYYSCIISLSASSFWYIFGIINEDYYIKICYGIEALFDLVQILLYKYLSRKYNQLNSENINFEIKDLKKIENTEINESKVDDDNTIEIDDNKQNFSKYENL